MPEPRLITLGDWPELLARARQRRAGATGRINSAIQRHNNMKTKKPDDRKFGTWFTDPAMDGTPELTGEQLKERFQTVYGIDLAKTKGSQKMLMHMDGSDWFSSSYEWDIGGHKILQSSCHKRSEEDAMHWGGGEE